MVHYLLALTAGVFLSYLSISLPKDDAIHLIFGLTTRKENNALWAGRNGFSAIL